MWLAKFIVLSKERSISSLGCRCLHLTRLSRRVGASYIKSRNKRIFVFIFVYTFMFLLVGFGVLRGSIYVVAMTLLSALLFEIAVIFVYGLVSKSMPIIKLVSLIESELM